jgi:hypothetical protein
MTSKNTLPPKIALLVLISFYKLTDEEVASCMQANALKRAPQGM